MKNISRKKIFLDNEIRPIEYQENDSLAFKLEVDNTVEKQIHRKKILKIDKSLLRNMLNDEVLNVSEGKIKIHTLIGMPEFLPLAELDDLSLPLFLNKIINLLNQHHITIDFLDTYDLKLQYKFITEELFEKGLRFTDLPEGIALQFIYEEFHPNHKFDIKQKVEKFIVSWFEQKKDKLAFSISDELISPEGETIKKKDLMFQITQYFNSFSAFKNGVYILHDIQISLKKELGTAYAEGKLTYAAITAAKGTIHLEGKFKIYFRLEYEWWSIYYFSLPDFKFEKIKQQMPALRA